jgi:hypothetical protein
MLFENYFESLKPEHVSALMTRLIITKTSNYGDLAQLDKLFSFLSTKFYELYDITKIISLTVEFLLKQTLN